MFGMQTANDYQPLTWWKRVPIYVTTIYVALNVLGMFATVIAATANFPVQLFEFDPIGFTHGAVWQMVTASFVNFPSFFFVFGMFFLYQSRVEVEKYLGRTQFLKLLITLLLVPAVVSLLWYYVAGVPYVFGGFSVILIGLFIAFATLYPNLEMFSWITLKWLAFAGLVLSSMMYLPRHDWPGLSILLAVSGVSFAMVRLTQRGGIGQFTEWLPKPKPKFHVVRKEMVVRPEEEDVTASIDPLLEKIAREGINSLTPKERAQLEKASKALSKKR
jgi:hypothetical protein